MKRSDASPELIRHSRSRSVRLEHPRILSGICRTPSILLGADGDFLLDGEESPGEEPENENGATEVGEEEEG